MSDPGRQCSYPSCGEPHKAKGFCSGHYQQQKVGRSLRPLRRVVYGEPISEKLAANSEFVDGCRVWTAYRNENGYGQVHWDGRPWPAHRAAYTLEHGDIPADRVINHICGNPACINVDHLEMVTQRENTEYRVRLPKHNTTGYRGVSLYKPNGQYVAMVRAGGIGHNMGYYATAEEAAQAAAEGRARLHTMPEFGARNTTKGAAA